MVCKYTLNNYLFFAAWLDICARKDDIMPAVLCGLLTDRCVVPVMWKAKRDMSLQCDWQHVFCFRGSG